MPETLRYLRDFRLHGISELVFTPHLMLPELASSEVGDTLSLHRDIFDAVLEEIGNGAEVPELGLGQEIYARSPEQLAAVIDRDDIGLAGSDTILLDFGFDLPDPTGVLGLALASGRPVVVAHPERYLFGDEDGLLYAERWRQAGALLQVNGGSLAGLNRPEVGDLAHRMFAAGLIDLVSSDHHGDYRTHPPELALDAVIEQYGQDAADTLFGEGPRNALQIGTPS